MLIEKDTSTKLERLFEINSFDIAISVAYSSNYDVANIMDIYRCVPTRPQGYTAVCLSFGPIGQHFITSATEACARRPGAAASVSRR